MIANFYIKSLNNLKYMRADEYDYDKFLEDSSDDHPKYSDGIEDQAKEQGSNDDSLERPSSTLPVKNKEDLKIAIHNVLELAQEGRDQLLEWDSDRLLADKSLNMVRAFLLSLKDANIELAKSDSD
jgi:hypothetical protein